MQRDADFKQSLYADNTGFSLHAAVRCTANIWQALEQQCRCITRPALANKRMQTNAMQVRQPLRSNTLPHTTFRQEAEGQAASFGSV